MKYNYCPYDQNYFATNLHLDGGTKRLVWDSARGQDVLLIQTPYGQNATERIEDICTVLENRELEEGKFVEVLSNIWVRYITATEKARENGCVLNGGASTYSVFGVFIDKENDVCNIYAPTNQAMISPFCDVPSEIHLDTERVERMEGLFKKKAVFSGFYRIVFPSEMPAGYMDGDLQYIINGFSVPITREMFQTKSAYVKTSVKPEIKSVKNGLRVI